MADLRLSLTQADPAAKDAVVVRLHQATCPDGMLQCPSCGGRTVLNTQSGVVVENGRRLHGAGIKVDVCADCDAKGIQRPMQPVPIQPIEAKANGHLAECTAACPDRPGAADSEPPAEEHE